MELTEKLKHLETNIVTLREIKSSISLDDLKLHKRHEWEVRYGKISSHYNLGNPKSYKECIELLVRGNYLSLELSKKIISMVGLRNLLVHEYAQIDDEKLYAFLNYLDDFILFVNEIKSNL